MAKILNSAGEGEKAGDGEKAMQQLETAEVPSLLGGIQFSIKISFQTVEIWRCASEGEA